MVRTPEQKQTMRRKLHARRIFAKNPLFAIAEIKKRYPDYNSDQLNADLKLKSKPKQKVKKKKPPADFRRCQLAKYADKMKMTNPGSDEYNHICITMAIMQNAHRSKEDISLLVSTGGKKEVYSFPWLAKEWAIKRFINEANKKDASHEQLKELRKNLLSGNYLK